MPLMTVSFTPESALGHVVRGAALYGLAALARICAYLHHPIGWEAGEEGEVVEVLRACGC